MKVLLAHNRYRLVGGEGRHVALLRHALDEAGVETRLFGPCSDALTSSRARRLTAAAFLTYRPGGGGIGRVLEEWRPDVVHFHNTWPLLTPAAFRVAKRAGAEVVLTAHNTRFACPGGTCTIETHPAANGLADNRCLAGSSIWCALRHNPRGSLAESVAYGFAQDAQRRLHILERWVDAIIAPSVYVAEMLQLAGAPMERVMLIPHGVPDRSVQQSEARFVLYAGRISPEKGIGTLIDAAAAAPEVPVAAAGEGPLLGRLRTSSIRHLGLLDRKGMDRALAESAFTVIPSECHESLSYGVIESLAASKPVIATAVGGLPEVVRDGETGLVVPPASPDALAAALRRLWANPELTKQLGENALQDARARFRLDLQLQRTIELYRRLLAGKPVAASVTPQGNRLVEVD
jgi:glycosyltransferase involved in cell wall biosynthesis